jgi:hypothetical protein
MAGLVPAIYCGTCGAQLAEITPPITTLTLGAVRQSFRDLV